MKLNDEEIGGLLRAMPRETPSTAQPSRSSSSTQARPMPLDAPVTRTRLPLRFRSISLLV